MWREDFPPDREGGAVSLDEQERDGVHELPEPSPSHVLTMRQRRVLQVIRTAIEDRGYPPSMREIGRRRRTVPTETFHRGTGTPVHRSAALVTSVMERHDPDRM